MEGMNSMSQILYNQVEQIADVMTCKINNVETKYYKVQWRCIWEPEIILEKFCVNIVEEYNKATKKVNVDNQQEFILEKCTEENIEHKKRDLPDNLKVSNLNDAQKRLDYNEKAIDNIICIDIKSEPDSQLFPNIDISNDSNQTIRQQSVPCAPVTDNYYLNQATEESFCLNTIQEQDNFDISQPVYILNQSTHEPEISQNIEFSKMSNIKDITFDVNSSKKSNFSKDLSERLTVPSLFDEGNHITSKNLSNNINTKNIKTRINHMSAFKPNQINKTHNGLAVMDLPRGNAASVVTSNDKKGNIYKCSTCLFATYDVTRFKRHTKLTHNNDKCFSCQLCSYSTSRSNNLKMHLRKHTGEKPFKCSLCNYSAAQKHPLKFHMVKHHGVIN